MSRMGFEQRSYAQVVFYRKLHELEENAFETFFHSIMRAVTTDYVPVRAYGDLGDMGADALAIYGDKLYACYGPRVPDIGRLKSKFKSDLKSALAQRSGEFSTFVFVHNDRLGLHPELATTLKTT